MPWWRWVAVGLVVFALVYGAFVLWLVVVGRREDARTVARFIPDCVVLISRLAREPRVSRRRKLLLLAVVGYLLLPIDLIPDFIPVAGQLDDAVIVALVLRSLIRSGGAPLVAELWPGPESSLGLILSLAGRQPASVT
jgi:uncharacterized membrane protein YkvA (DUF1232 family)